jgi:hypothetical protein
MTSATMAAPMPTAMALLNDLEDHDDIDGVPDDRSSGGGANDKCDVGGASDVRTPLREGGSRTDRGGDDIGGGGCVGGRACATVKQQPISEDQGLCAGPGHGRAQSDSHGCRCFFACTGRAHNSFTLACPRPSPAQATAAADAGAVTCVLIGTSLFFTFLLHNIDRAQVKASCCRSIHQLVTPAK